MTLHDEYVRECHGNAAEAAGLFAVRLMRSNPADPLRAGYSPENALIAAGEMFPEVAPDAIRDFANLIHPESFDSDDREGGPGGMPSKRELYGEPTCDVCHEPKPEGEPCECQAPAAFATVTIEFRAKRPDNLPSLDAVVALLSYDGPDEWYSYPDDESWRIVSVTPEKVERYNCPDDDEPGAETEAARDRALQARAAQALYAHPAGDWDAAKECWCGQHLGSGLHRTRPE